MSVVPSHGAGAWCAPAGGDAPLAGARVGPSPAAGPTRDSRRPMTTANTAKQPTQSAHRASNLFKRVWFDLANSYPNTPVRRGAVASARRASGLAGASFPPASRVPGRARSAPPPSGSAGSAPPPHARRRPPRAAAALFHLREFRFIVGFFLPPSRRAFFVGGSSFDSAPRFSSFLLMLKYYKKTARKAKTQRQSARSGPRTSDFAGLRSRRTHRATVDTTGGHIDTARYSINAHITVANRAR